MDKNTITILYDEINEIIRDYELATKVNTFESEVMRRGLERDFITIYNNITSMMHSMRKIGKKIQIELPAPKSNNAGEGIIKYVPQIGQYTLMVNGKLLLGGLPPADPTNYMYKINTCKYNSGCNKSAAQCKYFHDPKTNKNSKDVRGFSASMLADILAAEEPSAEQLDCIANWAMYLLVFLFIKNKKTFCAP